MESAADGQRCAPPAGSYSMSDIVVPAADVIEVSQPVAGPSQPRSDSNSSNAHQLDRPTLAALRRDVRLACISSWAANFGSYLENDFSIERLEAELTGQGFEDYSATFACELVLSLSYEKSITMENYLPRLRREFMRREKEYTILGRDGWPVDDPEGPKPFETMDADTKIYCLERITAWHMVDCERFRKSIEQDGDNGEWRDEPFGQDAAGNAYFYFYDGRLWLQRGGAPPPAKRRAVTLEPSVEPEDEEEVDMKQLSRIAEPAKKKAKKGKAKKGESSGKAKPPPRQGSRASSRLGKTDEDGWQALPEEWKGADRKGKGKGKAVDGNDSDSSSLSSLSSARLSSRQPSVAPARNANGKAKLSGRAPKRSAPPASDEEDEGPAVPGVELVKPVARDDPDWSEWEVICTTESEWRTLLGKLKGSRNKHDVQIRTFIEEDVLPNIKTLQELKEEREREEQEERDREAAEEAARIAALDDEPISRRKRSTRLATRGADQAQQQRQEWELEGAERVLHGGRVTRRAVAESAYDNSREGRLRRREDERHGRNLDRAIAESSKYAELDSDEDMEPWEAEPSEEEAIETVEPSEDEALPESADPIEEAVKPEDADAMAPASKEEAEEPSISTAEPAEAMDVDVEKVLASQPEPEAVPAPDLATSEVHDPAPPLPNGASTPSDRLSSRDESSSAESSRPDLAAPAIEAASESPVPALDPTFAPSPPFVESQPVVPQDEPPAKQDCLPPSAETAVEPGNRTSLAIDTAVDMPSATSSSEPSPVSAVEQPDEPDISKSAPAPTFSPVASPVAELTAALKAPKTPIASPLGRSRMPLDLPAKALSPGVGTGPLKTRATIKAAAEEKAAALEKEKAERNAAIAKAAQASASKGPEVQQTASPAVQVARALPNFAAAYAPSAQSRAPSIAPRPSSSHSPTSHRTHPYHQQSHRQDAAHRQPMRPAASSSMSSGRAAQTPPFPSTAAGYGQGLVYGQLSASFSGQRSLPPPYNAPVFPAPLLPFSAGQLPAPYNMPLFAAPRPSHVLPPPVSGSNTGYPHFPPGTTSYPVFHQPPHWQPPAAGQLQPRTGPVLLSDGTPLLPYGRVRERDV